MRKVAFTGGGSAGHVTPNLALIDAWCERGGEAIYLGRASSIEADLIARVEHLPFFSVPSERLRRYFHWANFIMPLYVIAGIWRAFWHLKREKPQVLFSKGGFVALPVVLGAWLNRIPVIIHESDGSLGLANRLSLPFTRIVCVAQERTISTVKHNDVRYTGSPVRRDFLYPNPQRATQQFQLQGVRPLLVIFGGSQGSSRINLIIRESLPDLLVDYEVFHLCGRGGLIDHDQWTSADGYHQAEYVHEGFADLLASAHLVIGRAGANGIAELNALQRPALLIPLPTISSRGDQLLNAQAYKQAGFGRILRDEELSTTRLIEELNMMKSDYLAHKNALAQHSNSEGTLMLIKLLHTFVDKSTKTS